MKPSNLSYLLSVARSLNLTSKRYDVLCKGFKSDWEAVFKATEMELWPYLPQNTVVKFLEKRKLVDPAEELLRVKKTGAKVLVRGAVNFPIQLENIPDPPSFLFVLGELRESDFPSISIVGSRKLTIYGKRILCKWGQEIAQKNITIVSGLAYGADIMAHKIAVENNCRTIGVLGSGIDRVYPQRHEPFVKEMLRRDLGVLVSEFLPGSEVRPENFPIRNRIVSGLSKATLVIEGALKSGSLITARIANEQGREVFCVPGELFAPFSAGPNQLIAKGESHLALSSQQILEMSGFGADQIEKRVKLDFPLTDLEKQILDFFGMNQKIHIDDLIRNSGLLASILSSQILLLEMKGLVQHLGNQIYVKA